MTPQDWEALSVRDREQDFAAWQAAINEINEINEPDPLPLVCGQCEHFVSYRREPVRGYCKKKTEYNSCSPVSRTYVERGASDLACPLIEVNCEF